MSPSWRRRVGIPLFALIPLACSWALTPPALAEEAAPTPTPRPSAEAALEAAKGGDAVIVIQDHEPDPSRIAGAAQIIVEEKLETYEYDDVQRVLATVPGVYLRVEDGFGLRPNIGLRGASSDRSAKVTLMEDGILLAPAPYAAPAAYYFPLVTTMRTVEVFKGPAAIRFGPQTVGGAINMLTPRIPTGPMGEVDLALGTFGFGKGHVRVGSGDERSGALLEAVHLQSSGFKELDGGGDTGFDKDEVRLKLALGSDPRRAVAQQLGLKLGYADEVSHETYTGLNQADFERTPYRRYAATQGDVMSWRRTQVELTHQLATAGGLTLVTAVYRHDFDRTWSKLNGFAGGPDLAALLDGPESGQAGVYMAILRGDEDSTTPGEALVIGNNHRTYVAQGIQTTAHLRRDGPTFGHAVEVGVRAHMDHIDRDHTAEQKLMVGGALIPDGGEVSQSTLNRGEARALAAYAQDEAVFSKLILTPGLRTELIWTRFYDFLGEDDEVLTDPEPLAAFDAVLLPGMGALYQLKPWMAVLAGVNRGFSAVSPGQAPEVRPEWSLNYEAGVRAGDPSHRLEVIGFLSDYQNLTSECTFSRGCEDTQLGTQYNAGAVTVYGVEAAGALSWDPRRGPTWDLGGTYTLTKSAFETSFDSGDPALSDVEVGDSLPYVPVHQGSAELGASGERWRVDLTASAVGAMRIVAGSGPIPEGEGTDAFVVYDLAANHDVGDFGSLYLKVDNLTNAVWVASRAPQGARPGKPQQLILGYKHHF